MEYVWTLWMMTPGDFAALEAALVAFQDRYETAARPFEWTFTRHDLTVLDPARPRRAAAGRVIENF